MIIVVGLILFVAGLWGIIKGHVGPVRGRGKAAAVVFAGLLVFIIGVVNSPQAKTNGPAVASTQHQADPQSAANPQQASTQQTSSQPPAAAQKAAALPGLQPVDVYLNLDKQPYSLKFGGFTKGVTRYQKCGKRDVGGETMEVCIDSNDVNDVVFINATVTGGTITSADLLLPYVATVPFEGNQPQKAKAWVTDNLPKLRQGEPVEIAIGGVRFTLFGNGSTNANLQLAPVK
jgi:uncharacterized ParB-like nuclease family protein